MIPARKTKPHSTPDRFWAQLNKQGPVPAHRPDLGPCWVWTGDLTDSGYGTLTYQCKRWRAHRLAYTLTNGALPPTMQVCHHCDNPPCCNPAHLYPGTHTDNMRDRTARGRYRVNGGGAAVGQRHWSAKLTDEDIRVIRTRYAAGAVTQRQLAADYGVAQSQIMRAVTGRSWKHIAPTSTTDSGE
jgi:hypothetical protein